MKSEKNANREHLLPYILITLLIFIAFCCCIFVFDIDVSNLPLNQLLMKSLFVDVYAAPSSSTPSQPEPVEDEDSETLSLATSNTLTGAYTIYLQTTSNSQLPTSYNNMINGIAFPHSTYQLFGAANYNSGAYIVGTMIQLYTESNYIKGNDYTLQLHFDMGSYLWPFWPNSSTTDWDFNGCPGAACEMNYQWLHDSSLNTLDITIKFRATSNSSAALFTFGRLDNNRGVFYNSYSQNQGIRLSSASITSTGSGNSDLSTVESGISDINDNLDNINDTLTDSNISSSHGSAIITEFNFFHDNTLSSVITAPINWINSFTNTCSPVSLTLFNQSITLPCGDTLFWNRTDVSTFRVFWNAFFGGLIIYRLLYKLFKTVTDALDPTKNELGGIKL